MREDDQAKHGPVARLTEYTTYADAQRHYASDALWALFDGNRDRLNLAHECIDRHATDEARIAVRIARADGDDEILTFRAIAEASSQFAHWLEAAGVDTGDRIAVMLEPSLAFYAAVFGAIKRGAVAVPLFTLFGPEGVRLRVEDCRPALLITNDEKWETTTGLTGVKVHRDVDLLAEISGYPTQYTVDTAAADLAAFQYTSGTTRALPEAVQHTHRAIVVVTNAALYATGVRPGDRFFCPSSPAWGHGMWHGTFAPLAMGVETGTFAGKFSPERMLDVLQRYEITNLSAAATHYRMMMNCGAADRHTIRHRKTLVHRRTARQRNRGIHDAALRSPGLQHLRHDGNRRDPGGLSRRSRLFAQARLARAPVPGADVGVVRADGTPCDPDEVGEIKVRRRGQWIATRDRGWVDGDGYFYHAGRADDVIISAGYTIGAVEVEDVLLQHPDVSEAAVIGVPDQLRGHVVKAYLVSHRSGGAEFTREIQEFVRTRLSAHEYPRVVAVIAALPKTPAGKVNRQALRDQEAAASLDGSSHGIEGHA